MAKPFLTTIAGTLAFPDEVALQDSDWLAEPFGRELDSRLVSSSPATLELFNWFNIKSLSSVTRLETIALGDVVSDYNATELVRSRSDLLGWLCTELKDETRWRLDQSLRKIEFVRTNNLTVQSVFELDDIPFKSSPRADEVVFDSNEVRVYVLDNLEDSYWIPAFRSIFSTLLAGEINVEIRKFALSADIVLSANSHEDAAKKLKQAGYEAPEADSLSVEKFAEEEAGELDFANSLDSIESDWDAKDNQAIEATGGHGEIAASNAHIAAEAGKNGPEFRSPVSDDPGSVQIDGSEDTKARISSVAKPESESKKSGTQKSVRKARTEWMRTYVRIEKDDGRENSKRTGPSQERISAIDEAAMTAVIDYEFKRGFLPERQPHFNPGYDILSRAKTSDQKRLIEVKGLGDEWSERGVKLSRTQISFAKDHPDEVWLYVVEHALDPRNRKINAIKNPFYKADEFWFDRVWRDVAVEKSGDYKSQFIEGRRIRVEQWGVGEIVETKQAGLLLYLKIKFADREKSLAFNATTMEILEN